MADAQHSGEQDGVLIFEVEREENSSGSKVWKPYTAVVFKQQSMLLLIDVDGTLKHCAELWGARVTPPKKARAEKPATFRLQINQEIVDRFNATFGSKQTLESKHIIAPKNSQAAPLQSTLKSLSEPQPYLADVLSKQGQKVKSIKQRYFTLHGYFITYYPTAELFVTNPEENELGKECLFNIHSVNDAGPLGPTHQICLSARFTSNRELVMSFPSQVSRMVWKKAFGFGKTLAEEKFSHFSSFYSTNSGRFFGKQLSLYAHSEAEGNSIDRSSELRALNDSIRTNWRNVEQLLEQSNQVKIPEDSLDIAPTGGIDRRSISLDHSHQGYLEKETKLGRWNQFFAKVADGNIKLFHRTDADAASPIAERSLQGAFASQPKSERKGKFAFRISFENFDSQSSSNAESKWILAAPTLEEQVEWIQNIESHVQLLEGNMPRDGITIDGNRTSEIILADDSGPSNSYKADAQVINFDQGFLSPVESDDEDHFVDGKSDEEAEDANHDDVLTAAEGIVVLEQDGIQQNTEGVEEDSQPIKIVAPLSTSDAENIRKAQHAVECVLSGQKLMKHIKGGQGKPHFRNVTATQNQDGVFIKWGGKGVGGRVDSIQEGLPISFLTVMGNNEDWAETDKCTFSVTIEETNVDRNEEIPAEFRDVAFTAPSIPERDLWVLGISTLLNGGIEIR